MEKAILHGPMSQFLVVLLLSLLALSAGRPAVADTFTETYYFNTGGIAESATTGNGFRDISPGPDLLPYTEDDEELLPGGNPGGTWTFAGLDLDGDGLPEHIFACIRQDDDDTSTLTSYSEFQHGVFAEGEDWIDLHAAFNDGPSGDGTHGVDPGNDFEWNDRPNWEGQSNWFWYNNAAANQRGLGGSRYYFELRNPSPDGVPPPFDEVQQWVKTVNLQTNADDPKTPAFSEKSGEYARGDNVVIKGLLIPIEAIPGLKDGELDPLFGWYQHDMARYVRDVLGPKIDDPNLTVFQTDEGGNACGRTYNLLPPTFIMIEQGEFHVTLLPGGGPYAAYWGIRPIEEGKPETTAVLRWCRIMLKGDDDSYLGDGMWNPPIHLVPEDGSRENLWRREKFVRENIREYSAFSGKGTGLPDTWGAIQLGCGIPVPDPDDTPPDRCWYFLRENDPQGIPIFEDCQADHVLTLPGGSGPDDSWFAMPFTQILDASKGKVRTEVQLRVQNTPASENRIQVILTFDGNPIAWAEMKDGDIALAGVGGHFGAGGGGPVTEGSPLAQEPTVILSPDEGVYTHIDLIFDAAAKKLSLLIDGTEILGGSYGDFSGHNVSALRIWTESGVGDENQIYVNEVALLQEFPRPFVRGEANCDGARDISDAIALVFYIFAGGKAPCCMAAADVDGDGGIDTTDVVSLLSFLFLDAAAPPLPYPACGVDWETSLTCDDFQECRP